jgi:hypothetical protein
MVQHEMKKHAMRRYIIARIKDMELLHLQLILGELRKNTFVPANIMGHTSADFARSIQTIALAWFATLIDQSRDGLNVFDLWRQLFPKHKLRIEEVWSETEPVWNIIRNHRDKVAFHADKPLAYFRAQLNTNESMEAIIQALDSFLGLSAFLLKVEDDELPELGAVAKEMADEIGAQLGCKIHPNWFSKLITMPEENV